jgi:hypothetical protein
VIPCNEPHPEFYGPPHKCANCGSRILDETGVPRGAGIPNVLEAKELENHGLYTRGEYMPWIGPAFQCRW